MRHPRRGLSMFSKPVFFDPTGKRGRFVKGAARIFGALAAVVVALFLAILVVVPQLEGNVDNELFPHVSIRCAWAPTCSPAHATTTASNPELLGSAVSLATELRQQETIRADRPPAAGLPRRQSVPAALGRLKDRPLSIGFYVNWDDNSYPALKQALPSLDWVIPSWLSLEGPTMELKTEVDDRALQFVRTTKPKTPILPMIQNAVDGKWDGPALARLLADPAARAERIQNIVSFLEANKYQGLTIDFEEVPDKSQPDLRSFLLEISQAFSAHGLALVLAVPFDNDSWPYADYAGIVDYMLLMGYDQHWDGSAAGSIAGQDWFERTLEQAIEGT